MSPFHLSRLSLLAHLAAILCIAMLTRVAYASIPTAASEDGLPEQDKWPTTVDAAVADIIASLSAGDKETVRSAKCEDLIRFHSGWGMGIRNHYGLWRGNNRLIESACGKECHPDDASMVIIERVLEKLRGQESAGCRRSMESTNPEDEFRKRRGRTLFVLIHLALGIVVFLIVHAWSLFLVRVAKKHDDAEQRRRVAGRYYLIVTLLLLACMSAAIIGGEVLGRFGRFQEIASLAALICALLPAVIWWLRRRSSLKTLGYKV